MHAYGQSVHAALHRGGTPRQEMSSKACHPEFAFFADEGSAFFEASPLLLHSRRAHFKYQIVILSEDRAREKKAGRELRRFLITDS
jgi:hypothetical protein